MITRDLPVLWRLLRGMPREGSPQQRLEGFYAEQAADYDRFRERLLHGRAELLAQVATLLPSSGGSLVELGCGTGRNLAFLPADVRARLQHVWGVDLCPSLLAQARQRGWNDVTWIEADATAWRPPQLVDAVVCSYSLSMIPAWFAVIDHALTMLRPGGIFAVVDFTLYREQRWSRAFWSWWFAHDGVHPSPDVVPYVRHRLPDAQVVEALASVPYVPGVRMPYFRCVGRKPA